MIESSTQRSRRRRRKPRKSAGLITLVKVSNEVVGPNPKRSPMVQNPHRIPGLMETRTPDQIRRTQKIQKAHRNSLTTANQVN